MFLKRTFCRLLVAIATFLIGTTSHWVLVSHKGEVSGFNCPIPPQERNELPRRPQQTEPAVVFDYDPTEFNPRGGYFILGRKPKAFREFDGLAIAVDEGEILGRVMIFTLINGESVEIDRITGAVTKQRISLVASPRSEEDFGYRFEGEFLRQGTLWRAGKSQAVLKGRLSKVKGGVTIAEAEVKFRIEYLGC